MIDTKSLQVASRTELPIGDLALSPNGEVLVGLGVHQRFSGGADECVGNGMYLLDPMTPEVRHHVAAGRAFAFDGLSPDGSMVCSWTHDPVAVCSPLWRSPAAPATWWAGAPCAGPAM